MNQQLRLQGKQSFPNISFTNTGMPILHISENADKNEIFQFITHSDQFSTAFIILFNDFIGDSIGKNNNQLKNLIPILESKPVYMQIESLFDTSKLLEIAPFFKAIFIRENEKAINFFKDQLEKEHPNNDFIIQSYKTNGRKAIIAYHEDITSSIVQVDSIAKDFILEIIDEPIDKIINRESSSQEHD